MESSSQFFGMWAMKKDGQNVKSTRGSAYKFKGEIKGNQLKGRKVGPTGMSLPFVIGIPSDGMSFKGTLEFIGKPYQIKGRRIE